MSKKFSPILDTVAFIGPRGQQGPKDNKGDKGDKGDTGQTGAKGDTGLTGSIGPSGPQGQKGDKGETGEVGPQGPPGARGDTGNTGAQGQVGPTGATGPQGVKGDTGAQGPAGPKGDDASPPPAKYIRVGQSGGDYQSIEAALAALTSPSFGNPYVIEVGPGVFSVDAQLIIPSGVLLRGQGLNSTAIVGAISATEPQDSSVIRLQEGANLADLLIENTAASPSGQYATGISAADFTTNFSRTGDAVDGTTIKNVGVVLNNAPYNTAGVFLRYANITLSAVTIRVFGGAGVVAGVFFDSSNDNGRVLIKNSKIVGLSGGFIGILTTPRSGDYGQIEVNLDNTTVTSDSSAIIFADGSGGLLRNSVLSSNVAGVVTLAGDARVFANQMTFNSAYPNTLGNESLMYCNYITNNGTSYLSNCGPTTP